jgi:hypothetical protein
MSIVNKSKILKGSKIDMIINKKITIVLIVLITLTLISLFSCNSATSSEKELELKEQKSEGDQKNNEANVLVNNIIENFLAATNIDSYNMFSRDFSDQLKSKYTESSFKDMTKEIHEKAGFYERYTTTEHAIDIKENKESSEITIKCIAEFKAKESVGNLSESPAKEVVVVTTFKKLEDGTYTIVNLEINIPEN